MHWWLPGAYASAPAVGLWIVARMPAAIVAAIFGTPAASFWLNHAGDTVFVGGWVVSAALLWLSRRRAARPPPAESDSVAHPPSRPGRGTRDSATAPSARLAAGDLKRFVRAPGGSPGRAFRR